ncbi:hypothetical protein [Sporosarcina sp. E16_8]|uniref:hypothetical protein n=1 Tax=Sporosarcina sp. E16_8 TaxID=2789295 RepID=UPI001A91E226|nr:hypothetical protein [Sporosarcina sp. E16_8]MBO0588223.1 hypothetical protein [Sporosarcina sp. E16_8]
MNKKRILSLAAVLGMTFLISGCNSDGKESETVEKEENANAEKYEEVFKETDEIAHDFMVVKIEQNYPKILKCLSAEGIEELREKKEYLLESHEYPNLFEELDGKYELQRYETFYDEEKRDVIYRYSRYNDNDEIINDWIIVEENENEEWKVKSFYGQRPDVINDGNIEIGTILHEFPSE